MSVLRLTEHPIQRTGAWAITVLAGRARPDEVTETDLKVVTDRIVDDLKRAAHAERDTVAYDWWKVLNALYPNSDVTHAARVKWTNLDDRVLAIFDDGEDLPDEMCVFCGSEAVARWAKAFLPLFDTTKALNTLPPSGLGWPVCVGCRVAIWAVPYGAAVTAGSATVLTGGSDELERGFVARNVSCANQIQAFGLGKLARGSPERVVVAMLRTVDADDSATMWHFKNDNQEPWLRVTETRRPVARFVRELSGNPDAGHGWKTLARLLTRRNQDGAVVESGDDIVAKTLFEPSGRPRPRLLEVIHKTLSGKGSTRSGRDFHVLTALARHYAKEMLDMDVDDLKPAADLIAQWIAAGDKKGSGKNSRGRFNEYAKVALKRYGLGRLLMAAEARLLLDKMPIPMTAADAQQIIDSSRDGDYRRMLLFYAVVDAVGALGAQIANKDDHGEDDVDAVEAELVPSSGDENLQDNEEREYA